MKKEEECWELEAMQHPVHQTGNQPRAPEGAQGLKKKQRSDIQAKCY
jgi:hypothetical protein